MNFLSLPEVCAVSEGISKNPIRLCEIPFEDLFWNHYPEVYEVINQIKKGESVAHDTHYAFSDISGEDKFSKKYLNCLGEIFIGTDTKTQETVSCLTHHVPLSQMKSHEKEFLHLFQKRIHDFLSRIDPDSVDVILFGGNYFPKKGSLYKNFQEDYIQSIHTVSDMIALQLGKPPTVITGPNLIGNETNVYFDTSERRLYMQRFEQPLSISNAPYHPYQIDEMRHRWDSFFEKNW